MNAERQIDFEKVQREIRDEWDMTEAVQATFERATIHPLNDGWSEVVFNKNGKPAFYVEVNADSEVWNMDFIQ